ncbi:hypothetical protein M5K25_016367 [Dendrobium thyrsiflorum]|uniref:Uncharacterized protein n=1 Tax=Dendrobium thyrsiflorum TaxID=117978 RepID=A0ABD0URV2_DENTH
MNGRRTCCLNVSASRLRCRLAKIDERRGRRVSSRLVHSPRVAKMVPTVATANGNSPNLCLLLAAHTPTSKFPRLLQEGDRLLLHHT